MCQQDKVENKTPVGLLEPLLVLEGPWENISMDFVIDMQKIEGFGTILVIVDRFSKYTAF